MQTLPNVGHVDWERVARSGQRQQDCAWPGRNRRVPRSARPCRRIRGLGALTCVVIGDYSCWLSYRAGSAAWSPRSTTQTFRKEVSDGLYWYPVGSTGDCQFNATII